MAVIRQEAELVAQVPDHLVEVLARFTRALRESSSVDQRSGVSARFSIAGAETVAAAALHRATRQGEPEAVARGRRPRDAPWTCWAARSSSRPVRKGASGRSSTHLLRTSIAETARATCRDRLRPARRRAGGRRDRHDR